MDGVGLSDPGASDAVLLSATADDPACPRRHYRQAVEQLVKLYEAMRNPAEVEKWQRVPRDAA
jgi:hypothetical protein